MGCPGVEVVGGFFGFAAPLEQGQLASDEARVGLDARDGAPALIDRCYVAGQPRAQWPGVRVDADGHALGVNVGDEGVHGDAFGGTHIVGVPAGEEGPLVTKFNTNHRVQGRKPLTHFS